jgi:hypothetical protein
LRICALFSLLSKFSSKNSAIKKYRRLSGCNYNVAFQEILESEKKLRVRQVLELARNDELSIKSLSSHSFDEGISGIDNSILSEFFCVFVSDYLEICKIGEGVTLYVCGYTYKLLCMQSIKLC